MPVNDHILSRGDSRLHAFVDQPFQLFLVTTRTVAIVVSRIHRQPDHLRTHFVFEEPERVLVHELRFVVDAESAVALEHDRVVLGVQKLRSICMQGTEGCGLCPRFAGVGLHRIRLCGMSVIGFLTG